MKLKNTLTATAGIIIGGLLTILIMYNSAPDIMMIESKSRYGFEESVEKFRESVKEKGWKIPIVHDLKKTMNKFGKEVKNVKVFELCHPDHAYKVLAQNDERIVSSLMPCRVSIYEKADGSVYISRMNTALMGSMMDGVVPEVMADASHESEIIISAIAMK